LQGSTTLFSLLKNSASKLTLGLWSTTDNTFQPVASTSAGGPGPNLGAGISFRNLSSVGRTLTESGKVVFEGQLTGTGVNSLNDDGIWTTARGQLEIVARTDDDLHGPGLGPGIQFDDFVSYEMNDAGDITFVAEVAGTGITISNDVGLCAWVNGQIIKLAREGDWVDIHPDPQITELRRIDYVDVWAPTINNKGQLAMSLRFTDDTSGIFAWQLPRPPGDFDLDGDVDGADFVAWQSHFPTASGATLSEGDADGDGDVDGADFVVWQTHFPTSPSGAATPVPEPAAGALAALSAVAILMRRKRQLCRSNRP
jgi:hypothetical protein